MNAKHRRMKRRGNRGSALLVTLMVMAGLSLLGLAFVSISETENTISVNERNYTQTLAVAEAGARVVLEWFQDPTWALAQELMPLNDNAYKNERIVTDPGGSYPAYTGRYKSDGGMLCDKPFKPKPVNRFYGTDNAADADIYLNSTNASAFLTEFNRKLFPNMENGQITEILIYAPPIIGGTVNADGFWESGTRYGLATIKVTAELRRGTNTVAKRWVKLVVSEWPFPGPQGPVQSNANISTGGNFGVHWGRMTSDEQMDVKRPFVGLPWFSSADSIAFEHGYFTAGQDHYGSPNDATDFRKQHDWLYQISGIALEDPWFQVRAKTDIINPIASDVAYGNNQPHPFKYDNVANDVVGTTAGTNFTGWSNWFQHQSYNDGAWPPADHRMVIFPKIDYEFWKNIAMSGSQTSSGVHYLRWVSGENYTDGVETKSFGQWVNTARATNPAKSGFYFFDSRNGLNPQGSGAPGILAPPIDLNSSDDGSTLQMKGFIYLNTETYGSTGIGGPNAYYNFPGEPYRDVGHWKLNTARTAYELDGAGDKIPIGAGDGEFSFGDVNDNKRLDVFIEGPFTVTRPNGTSVVVYRPKPYSDGCAVGTACSEPHEPYLNLIYPTETVSGVLIADACCAGGGAPNGITVGWQAPGSVTKLPTKKNTAGTAPQVCDATLTPDPDCTHNGWNKDGPLTYNFGNVSPILDGVLYNEGDYDTQGNAAYFGSILINGDILGTGTPEVWFDEFLVKGGWQDKFKDMPRVYVTAHETDQ